MNSGNQTDGPHDMITMNRVSPTAMLLAALLLGACGGGDPDLPPLAAEGRQIARDSGCASCHGRNGEGGVGPAWQGLMGSQVALDDGSTVTADEQYLARSISDPGAEIVAEYTVRMPENKLTADQIDAVIAYIDAISAPTDE